MLIGKIRYALIAYRNSLYQFSSIKAVGRNYLLKISLSAFAGKNLTFCDAAIWICSPVLGLRPILAFLLATL
jgi:hypothetical protein